MNIKEADKTKNYAVVYGRISTERKNGHKTQNVRRQFVNLEPFAHQQGYEIAEYFADSITGKSSTTEREGFNKMIAYAKAHGIKTIFSSELSRISRRVSHLTVTIEQLVEEYGMTIIIQHPRLMVFKPDENGKLDIIAKMMLMMLGLGAEMELHYQQARRLEGIEIAKKEGRYKGRIAGSAYSKDQLFERHRDIVNLLKYSSLPDTKIQEATKKGLSTIKRVKKLL